MEILVVSYSRIGDTILATSLINHLIKKHSDAEFTVVTSTISKDIFTDMPRLKKLIVIDKQKYAGHWYKIWSFVKDKKWDLVVDLRSSYLSYFLEVNERKIFKGNQYEHKLEQFSNFLQIEDNIQPTIWADQQKYNNILKSKKISDNFICVAPISNWQGKDWPIDKYYKLFEDPLFSDFEVVILGATDKASDNTKIKNLKESLSIKVNNLMNKLI
jgi:ADP-heptose:LPS heptosyltransferase